MLQPDLVFDYSMSTINTSLSPLSARLQSIDALRGFVIVLMLLDHVRETFFLHMQVSDPMDVETTEPSLFFSRLLAHLCAPVFVFLTGLSAFLYASKHENSQAAAAAFLFKRGLFLVLLEWTLVNFAWTFQFPPSVVYMQVIWAIGLSMMALSILLWLPRVVLIGIAVVLVAGHNMLDNVHFAQGHWMHGPWAILHDRGWLQVTENLRARTSYPVLPWFGVIALGYACGPWFVQGANAITAQARQKKLLLSAACLLVGFVVLRVINVYGDKPWHVGESGIITLMSFINITKYPPSLLFIMLTLGLGFVLLWGFERLQAANGGNLPSNVAWLKAFGAAPMFFYLLHLYVLKLLYLVAVAVWGLNQGDYFGVDSVWQVWLITIAMAAILYWPVKAFAQLKARRKDIAWLKYF